MQAIRGAISVEENTAGAIIAATKRLLLQVAEQNNLRAEEVISIVFTATPDLNAAFPARAAREVGWTQVALLDAVEMDVPQALPRTIRLLLLADRPHQPASVKHVYLGEAAKLRPDWAASGRT
ncbi:MAG: chorismate mutase [Bacillota bacterium]|jgi:chorismate mutase